MLLDFNFTFTTEKCIGTKEKAYMTYQRFPKDVKPGERIMVDDGKLLFHVISTNKKDEVVVKVKKTDLIKRHLDFLLIGKHNNI